MASGEDKTKEFFSEFRVSRRLSAQKLGLLVIGFAFCLAFVVAYPLVASDTPRLPVVSYLFAGLLAGFTVWTVLDMARQSPEPHGLYRLTLRADADWLAFLEGWTLLGGKVVLVALLGQAFARYLFSAADIAVSPWAYRGVALGAILVGATLNFLGQGPRRLPGILLGFPVVGYLAALGIARWTGGSVAFPLPGTSLPVSIWASTALALVGYWGLEAALAESEELRHVHTRLSVVLVAVAAAIALLPGAASLILPASSTGISNWPLWARWGQQVTSALAAMLTAGVLWWVLLIAGKQGHVMARHSFLSPTLARLHSRFHTPVAFQSVATAAALLLTLAPFGLLVPLASFAFAIAALGADLAAVVAHYKTQAAERTTGLPFFPLVPGLGIAAMLFLMAFLPARAWLGSAVWLGIGVAIYFPFVTRWRAQRQAGITVFKEEEAVERPRADFRILAPVANPDTAQQLMALAAAIAKGGDGEIIALQVVEAPAQLSVAAGRRLALGQLHALEEATAEIERLGVPVHAMTRVARSAHEGILDTASEEDCDLIILGWTQRTRAMPGSLGRILDPVLNEAPCDVLVASGGFPSELHSILVPVAGGPHALKALELADELAQATGARVTALHILPAEATDAQEAEARRRLEEWIEPLKSSAVSATIVRADNVVQAIVREAERSSLVMMGTSSESWLDRVLFGVVPEQVGSRSKTPLILVKAYTGLARLWGQRIWGTLFNLFPTLQPEETLEVSRGLREGARGNVNFYVLIVLSAIIASIGLLSNSAAVIIGAMLVAPFMSPILAVSLGIVLGDARSLSRGIESTVKGVGAAIVLAAFTALIFPIAGLTPEILVRTRPTVLDLVVALASGAAGAYAISRKELAAALPGVAIAAALMPPVCTVGIGIAQGNGSVVGGALLLFVTNVVAIIIAGALIFLLLGMRPKTVAKERRVRLRRWLGLTAALLFLVLALLVAITLRTGQINSRATLIQQVLQTQLARLPSAALISVDSAAQANGVWQVEATAEMPAMPSGEQVAGLSAALAQALDQPVDLRLRVILIVEAAAQGAR